MPSRSSSRPRAPKPASSAARGKRVTLDPAAMSELFKPARLEVYEGLQVAGPSTIADLARRLGRPADSLYYHVKKLLDIGVVEERAAPSGDRGTPARGRRAAVYAVVTRRLDVKLDPASPESREAWGEGGAAVLRVAQRDFAAALERPGLRGAGAGRNLALRRVKVRLDAAQLKQVNAHLDALNELLLQHAENTTGDLHAVTVTLTTLEERTER